MIHRLLLSVLLASAAGHAFAADLVARAQGFMQAYARDLAAGDRQAVARRYARRGAIFMSGGRKEELSFAQLAQDYASRWTPPASFQWQSLAYELVGEQSVLVTGGFSWATRAGAEPVAYGYAALLVVEDGELRIRLEDETPQSPPCPK